MGIIIHQYNICVLQGAYCNSTAAVRAERVAGEKYDSGGAVAALTNYYTSDGASLREVTQCLRAHSPSLLQDCAPGHLSSLRINPEQLFPMSPICPNAPQGHPVGITSLPNVFAMIYDGCSYRSRRPAGGGSAGRGHGDAAARGAGACPLLISAGC